MRITKPLQKTEAAQRKHDAQPAWQTERGLETGFVDARPQAAAQRRLQEMTDGSPHAAQLQRYVQMMQNARPAAQLRPTPSSPQPQIAPPVMQFSLVGEDAEKLSNVFYKWLTKGVKSVFTPYFLSELDGALMAFYTYQDAYDYLADLVKTHDRYAGQFSNAVLGAELGKGSEKNVFEMQGHPNIVIGISNSENPEDAMQRLRDEAGLLNDLKLKAEIPVAEIIGIIDYKGKAATLMRRYAQGSKSVVANDKEQFNKPVRVGNSAYLNATSIEDLNEIIFKFQKKKVRIDDIQFLIGSDGSVVVADPLTATVGQGAPTSNMIVMAMRLIEAAAENVLLDFLQSRREAFAKGALTKKLSSVGVDESSHDKVLLGLLTWHSSSVKRDSGADTYRYNFLDEVD